MVDWFNPRRGLEWKQERSGQILASLSLPPLPLMAVFGIVIFLLSLSLSTNYKAQMYQAKFSFQLLLLLVLGFVLIVLMRSSFTVLWHSSCVVPRTRREPSQQAQRFPWGVAIFLAAVLLLISYRSTFQSKWFPFG